MPTNPAALIAASLLSVPIAAGWQTAQTPSAPTLSLFAEPTAPREPVLSVQFEGGSIDDYVVVLRRAANPEPVNVVYARALAKTDLAPITLSAVTLEAAVRAIQSAAGEPGSNFNIRSISTQGAAVFAIDAPAKNNRTRQITMEELQEQRRESIEMKVFSLAPLVDTLGTVRYGTLASTDSALEAVQAALELSAADGTPAADVKYHRESNLLLVRGNHEQLFAVQSCIERLQADAERRQAQTISDRADPSDLMQRRSQLLAAQSAADQRRVELELAEALYGQTAAQRNEGAVAERELLIARAEVEKRRAQMVASQAQIAQARDSLAMLEARAFPARPPGPVMLDLSAWENGPYSDLEKVLHAIFGGQPASPRFSSSSRVLKVEGLPSQIQSVLTVLQEFARVRGLEVPSPIPAPVSPAAAPEPKGDGAAR